jgi:hypothetical protein
MCFELYKPKAKFIVSASLYSALSISLVKKSLTLSRQLNRQLVHLSITRGLRETQSKAVSRRNGTPNLPTSQEQASGSNMARAWEVGRCE